MPPIIWIFAKDDKDQAWRFTGAIIEIYVQVLCAENGIFIINKAGII